MHKSKTKVDSSAIRKPKPESRVSPAFFLSVCLIVVALFFYGNTLMNDYALDDGLVFTSNKFVLKGFSGIGKIISHDSFYGTLGAGYNLNGGRWRPLSLISFAIEYQFFGLKVWISHLINVLLYALTAILLMNFFRAHVFTGHNSLQEKKTMDGSRPLQDQSSQHISGTGIFSSVTRNSWLAFFTALLFIIHPVHTEVVANIKSRDELFSLLFLILTLHYVLKWVKEKKIRFVIAGLIYYSLALLSKENGLTFVFLIPITIYFLSVRKKIPLKTETVEKKMTAAENRPGTSFSLRNFTRAVYFSWPFLAVAVVYLLVRISLIGFKTAPVTELMDNPYMLATAGQKFATIAFALLYYFRLLIFPHPLTYDYSYNQIPYHQFSDLSVIASLLIHAGLVWYVFYYWKKDSLIVWGIIFYLTSIFIVSNLVLSVGTTLAERFLYQSSVAFCLVLVILFDRVVHWMAGKNPRKQSQMAAMLGILILIPAAAKTISRNQDWKNDSVLFIHDEKVSDKSARAATYAALRYNADGDTISDKEKQKEYRRLAIAMCYKSNGIYAPFASNYLNWGAAYSRADSLEKAEWAWNEARKIKPGSNLLLEFDKYLSEQFFNRGLKAKALKDGNNYSDSALALFRKALRYDSTNAEIDYNIGVTYFEIGDHQHALEAYTKAISKKPGYAAALNNKGVIYFTDKMYDQAEVQFQKSIQADSSFSDAYANLGSIYRIKGNDSNASFMYIKALQLNPGNRNACLNLVKIYQNSGDKEKANYYQALANKMQ